MDQAQKKSALRFIFLVLLIDVTGLGLIIPVVPRLIQELIQGDISEASKYGGWLTFAYAITQFFFGPIMGNLGDKYGRRPVLLGSMLAFSLDYLLLCFAPNILWLFIARIVAGITGASFSTAASYIADISTNEEKAKNFGLIGAAFGIGFIIGPMMGGLLGSYGTRTPFWVAACLCFLNFVYGYFKLPESLALENRRPFEWKRATPGASFRMFKKHTAISGLVITLALVYIAGHSVQANWNYYTIYKFNWDEKMVGLSLGVMGIMTSLVQGVLIRWINPKLGNEKSIYLGLFMYGIGMILFSMAFDSWMMYAICVPYCLGGIAGPAIQSIISSNIPRNEQGQMQGALTSIMSASTIIGPPIMTNLFYFFTHNKAPFIFPGAPFVLGATLMFLAAFIAWYWLKYRLRKKEENQ